MQWGLRVNLNQFLKECHSTSTPGKRVKQDKQEQTRSVLKTIFKFRREI